MRDGGGVVYGYVREERWGGVSVRDQGRTIASYCRGVLGVALGEDRLYIDYCDRAGGRRGIKDREGARALWGRVRVEDAIVIHSLRHLFPSIDQIRRWSRAIRDSRVSIHLASRGKELLGLTGEELLDCFVEQRRVRGNTWGAVILTNGGTMPVGKSRWIRANYDGGGGGHGRADWVKISESGGKVVPVLARSHAVDDVITRGEAERDPAARRGLTRLGLVRAEFRSGGGGNGIED